MKFAKLLTTLGFGFLVATTISHSFVRAEDEEPMMQEQFDESAIPQDEIPSSDDLDNELQRILAEDETSSSMPEENFDHETAQVAPMDDQQFEQGANDAAAAVQPTDPVITDEEPVIEGEK